MPWLHNRLQDHMGAKLVSLALAVALWAALAKQPSGQEAFEATVRYDRVPDAMEVNPDQVGRVTVLLEGARGTLEDLRSSGLVLAIDCSQVADESERTVTVSEQTLQLPRGVALAKAVPSQFRFSLQAGRTREVEVMPNFVGGSQDGYLLEDFEVTPARLTIVGPADRVALVEQIGTDPVDLTGVIGPRSFEAAAFVTDPYVRFQGPARVRIEVRMRKR